MGWSLDTMLKPGTPRRDALSPVFDRLRRSLGRTRRHLRRDVPSLRFLRLGGWGKTSRVAIHGEVDGRTGALRTRGRSAGEQSDELGAAQKRQLSRPSPSACPSTRSPASSASHRYGLTNSSDQYMMNI